MNEVSPAGKEVELGWSGVMQKDEGFWAGVTLGRELSFEILLLSSETFLGEVCFHVVLLCDSSWP